MESESSSGADSATVPNGTNIVLVGFMGTGKSSVGREVARLLGYGFVDTDDLIVRNTGRKIPEIFETDGESGFRQLETGVLKDLSNAYRQVVSTGGGIVLSEENRNLVNRLGFVVWLTASEEETLRRVARSDDRPLINCDDPSARLQRLMKDRNPLYDGVADLSIDSTELSISEVAYGVVESARVYFAERSIG